MALTYKYCEPGADVSHVCDPCLVTEKGGIRSFFLVKETSTLTLASTLAEWTAALESGEVVIIPETRGTYDGGTPKMGSGYGNRKERVLGYDNVIAIKDPAFKENVAFWEWAEKCEWRFGFRTDTMAHLSDKAGTLTVKAPVEEDTESEVVWNVEAKWFSTSKMDVAAITPIKSIFTCYQVTV